MNWGLTRIAFDGTRTPLKTALFLVVCFAWLLPGLVGHDPWKVDEAVVFGAVTEMLRSGDWLVFRIAGEPYLEKAPLFLWVAATLAKGLSMMGMGSDPTYVGGLISFETDSPDDAAQLSFSGVPLTSW